MKISTDAIQGFADMTTEQKLDAIMALEVPDPVDLSGFVKKDVFDAKASEAANLAKQLRSKQTDDEAAKAQAETERKALEENYKALLRKSTVAEHTAKFLALGYEEKLARETAEALFDGNMDKVFENQQAFKASMEKTIKADVVKQTPTPSGAGGGSETEKSEAAKIAERIGTDRATAMSNANNILGKYTGGN